MMGRVSSSFAVSRFPLKRATAFQGGTAHWQLYDYERLAEKLGIDPYTLRMAMIETGFDKAVRIRQEVIHWKERLRFEEREAEACGDNRRLKAVRENLVNVRNLLRIPRHPDSPLLESGKVKK